MNSRLALLCAFAFEGQSVTNSAIVPAGVNGAVHVFAFRPTFVSVGVYGYFGR